MFPERLKRLTLTNTALAWNEMWTLGMLPNLEVLKLKLHACVGQLWETSDNGFLRLKFLKFQDLDIVQWTASSNHFPHLEHLVLHGCQKLEEIPSSLGDIPTLEMIDVRWCSETAANSAHVTKKDQENKGNDCVKEGIICPDNVFFRFELGTDEQKAKLARTYILKGISWKTLGEDENPFAEDYNLARNECHHFDRRYRAQSGLQASPSMSFRTCDLDKYGCPMEFFVMIEQINAFASQDSGSITSV
ncbi:hypothetical protein LguiA_022014 [Lonicera macranthoides]